jgi:hypothetical protein
MKYVYLIKEEIQLVEALNFLRTGICDFVSLPSFLNDKSDLTREAYVIGGVPQKGVHQYQVSMRKIRTGGEGRRGNFPVSGGPWSHNIWILQPRRGQGAPTTNYSLI